MRIASIVQPMAKLDTTSIAVGALVGAALGAFVASSVSAPLDDRWYRFEAALRGVLQRGHVELVSVSIARKHNEPIWIVTVALTGNPALTFHVPVTGTGDLLSLSLAESIGSSVLGALRTRGLLAA
jgi:hypothetical protein